MLTLALWAATLTVSPSCSKAVSSHPDGNYMTPGVLGDIVYKNDLTLDAYAPEGPPRPGVLLIHGSVGNKRTHITQLFDPLSRANVSWFSIDYRTLEDVEEALRFIRCPGRFNITNTMFVIGEDTGGRNCSEISRT
jgi:hypothetical protein